jgi:hypothetical protein
MRTKVIVSILFLLPASALAKDESVLLKVTVKGPYATQSTEVFRDKQDWICKTEHNPYSVSAKGMPYSKESFAMVAKTVPSKEKCRDAVTVTDNTVTPAKHFSGCAEDLAFKPFLQELNKNCGR